MPFVELQNHVCFFNVFNDSSSDNCSIYSWHSQRDRCLWGIPDSCFSISSFLKLGNFRLIVSLILLLQIFSVFGSTRIISILPNGTGPFWGIPDSIYSFTYYNYSPKGTGALGNLQIHVCSNLSSYSTCSVVSYYSQGGGPLGNWRFMFCILAYLSSPWFSPYSKRGGRLWGDSDSLLFSIDSASCSDHSHSQRDGNSRLLFLQLVIPKFADIWGNSDYYPCFQLLPTGRVPSTSYDQSSQRNKCLLGRFMCVQLFWLF